VGTKTLGHIELGEPEMIPRKMLIEVALPLEAINRGCEQDKNRKTGHIRNLHKWFAPMPLPAWRAILLASVIQDPGNELPPTLAAAERERLFQLISSVAPLDAFEKRQILGEARAAVIAATGGRLPTVVDPFCGGGSTIVEAQRLGFPTIAGDLNPVPVIITTALCRIPQLFKNQKAINPEAINERTVRATGLAAIIQDVRYYAGVIRNRAWKSLARYYPAAKTGAEIIAWRWAWAVPSPNPAWRGAMTPLSTDWTLARSERNKSWVTPRIDGHTVGYDIASEGTPPEPTAGGNSAKCLFSGDPITFEYIRAEGTAGRLQAQMFAMVADGDRQRVFLPADADQIEAALDTHGLDLPEAALPDKALGFRVQSYGVKRFSDLFLPRQARSISTFSELVGDIHADILQDALRSGVDPSPIPLEAGGQGARAYADAVTAILGLCVGRLATSNNVLVQWFIDPRSGTGKATPAFRMQTVSMVWDFVETNPFAQSVGGWDGPVVESALNAFKLVAQDAMPAEVFQSDAREIASRVPEDCLVATDPPYYANIGYADLSDFFYVWLRRSLREVFPDMFSTVATPKSNELIAAPYRHGDDEDAANEYFRSGFRDIFRPLAERAGRAYPLSVIYAIKQHETKKGRGPTGWEVFLDGLIEAGLSVVATWPIRTTTLTRSRGLLSNALASAICVVCRPRLLDASDVSRREFLAELRTELQVALGQFQTANIAPVDLGQAAVGRGMAVFSQYARVLESDGMPMSVGNALRLINQILDEVLTDQEVDFDTESRCAIVWFDAYGISEGPYGDAEKIAVAKNTSVEALVDADILVAKAGKARLKQRNDLVPIDFTRNTPVPVWQMVQHLCARLEGDGETAAAELVTKLGASSEGARELAYRLYTVCERKKLALEALSYNALVQSWPEISRLARERRAPQAEQSQMFR
jgi:putative DNA methylase